MKKIILIIVCVSLLIPALAQKTLEPYEYPVRPGTEEWKGTRTHDGLREVNQIPSEVIGKMDTPTLLLSVLRYPLIGDLLVFRSFREGIDQLRKNFTAFDSLLNRSDLIEALIPVYVDYDPKGVDALNDPLEIGEFMLGLSLLEFIMREEAVTDRIDPDQRSLVQEEILLKYVQKQLSIEKYGNLGLSTGVWALSVLVGKANINESWISEFVEQGFTLDYAELDLIVNQLTEN